MRRHVAKKYYLFSPKYIKDCEAGVSVEHPQFAGENN